MPRLKIIRAEVGTSGTVEDLDVSGVEDEAGVRAMLGVAVDIEHPCVHGEHENTCDIAAALGNDGEFWAAHILQGATECPLVDAAVSHAVRVLGPDTVEALIEADRGALLADVAHRECPACGAVVWGEDETVCGNCLADIPELPDGEVRVSFDLGNAALQSRAAVAEVLRDIADAIEDGGELTLPVRDANGNRVGRWEILPRRRRD